jgi:hypothetical protein
MTIDELVLTGSICMIVMALLIVFIVVRANFIMRKFNKVHKERDIYYNNRFDIMERMMTTHFTQLLEIFKK